MLRWSHLGKGPLLYLPGWAEFPGERTRSSFRWQVDSPRFGAHRDLLVSTGGGGGFSPHQKRIRAVLATRGRGEAGRGRGGGVRGPKELHKATAKAAAPLVTAVRWRGSPGAAARLPNARSGARGSSPGSSGVPLLPRTPPPTPPRLPCPHTLWPPRRLREGAQPAADGHRGAGLRRHADRHRADAE